MEASDQASRETEESKSQPDYHHKTRQGLDARICTPRTIAMKEIHKNLYLGVKIYLVVDLPQMISRIPEGLTTEEPAWAENSNYDHQKVDRRPFLKAFGAKNRRTSRSQTQANHNRVRHHIRSDRRVERKDNDTVESRLASLTRTTAGMSAKDPRTL
ncbi:hypothetical protein F4604DRAFT_1686158 [Suillus subluteus]|nr:hypothetical protein F4604DRAFT_1686158 [Suillus subluteus]